ncbi:MAG: purine-nucleoside phosphorylase, partial [Actinomycetota bacterium]
MVVGSANAYEVAKLAATDILKKFGGQHDVLAVLGSGWAHAATVLEATDEISVTEIQGFIKPSAIGHGGTLKSVRVGDSRVLLLTGRTHLYEGHGVDAVVHAVRTAAFAGCKTVVLTNAAGCLRTDWGVGATALITDHINLTGFSPLTGADAPPPLHGRFVDLTDAYSARLRKIAKMIEPTLHEGVYMGFHGPHFETPAEIRAARVWGADLVGMSTVMETIAARHMGMEVLALSLATNLAAGISGEKLSGDEVLAISKAAAGRVGPLLAEILKQIDKES